ncbi:MAG: hypothetical protein U5N85_15825 [Arcicella sp.]|nr:hypothetical protein [Arcicella sp.]
MLNPRYDIVNNYTVLHFDEWDILFAGRNANNEWIVGSLAYDDDENNVLHHYYLVVSEKSITHFLKREISYRALFQQAMTIFKTLRDINENLLEEQELSFQEISKKSLPSEKGFCPKSDEQEELLQRIPKRKMTFSNNWQVFKHSDIIQVEIQKKREVSFKKIKLLEKVLIVEISISINDV